MALNHSSQIRRIQSKLKKVADVDKRYKVFGSSSHRYQIDPPANEAEITRFEQKYSLQLPETYRSFISTVGNGGNGYSGSGAGPHYGIFKLGHGIYELIHENLEIYLNNKCILRPDMTDEEWEILSFKQNQQDISEEEYNKERAKLFAGVLPIGPQGCTYIHGLILNGPFTGKVVNLDIDFQKPIFTYEDHFLDWYERWLDEIISGDLLVDYAPSFGYNLGGTEEELLALITSDTTSMLEALQSLLLKRSLKKDSLGVIRDLLATPIKYRSKIIEILAKHKYENWETILQDNAEMQPLESLQTIHQYDKINAQKWCPIVYQIIDKTDNSEVFDYGARILEASNEDYGIFMERFIQHKNAAIRSRCLYSLGQLNQRERHLKTFIIGLNDTDNRVILYSLQSLSGITHHSLLPEYKKLALRFTSDDDYIISNLSQRLAEFNTDLRWIRNNHPDQTLIKEKVNKSWFQKWFGS